MDDHVYDDLDEEDILLIERQSPNSACKLLGKKSKLTIFQNLDEEDEFSEHFHVILDNKYICRIEPNDFWKGNFGEVNSKLSEKLSLSKEDTLRTLFFVQAVVSDEAHDVDEAKFEKVFNQKDGIVGQDYFSNMYDEDGVANRIWVKMSISFGGQDQTVEINKTSEEITYKNKVNFNSHCIGWSKFRTYESTTKMKENKTSKVLSKDVKKSDIKEFGWWNIHKGYDENDIDQYVCEFYEIEDDLDENGEEIVDEDGYSSTQKDDGWGNLYNPKITMAMVMSIETFLQKYIDEYDGDFGETDMGRALKEWIAHYTSHVQHDPPWDYPDRNYKMWE